MNTNKTKLVYQFLALVIPFIAYIITLAPTVTFIDAGELTTVCAKLGVAHPTGYPLFTILGHLFSLLPFGSVVYSLNFMCAVISSVTVLIFFNLMVFIFTKLKLNENDWENTLSIISIYNISLGASLVLAFSRTFWDTSNAIEVYSLHTLFIVTNLYLFLRACHVTVNNTKENLLVRERYWLVWSFVLGLSFGNHLSTIFLSVGIFVTYLIVSGVTNPITYKRILLMAIPFILGLSIYIYLPVRASNPVISWGHPDTWGNFYRHFTGQQFSVWMFTGTEVMAEKLGYFVTTYLAQFFYLPDEFPGILKVLPLAIILIGLFEMAFKKTRLFLLTILLFVFCVLYASNYNIHDIDSYFLLAYIITAIWIGYFLQFVIRLLSEKKRTAISFVLVLFAVLPVLQNFKYVNESQNYYVKDYTFNVFNSVPQNSIVMSTQWDFWISASIYFQYVEGIRKDIVVIDKELLRKTWYVPYIKEHYPEVYANSKSEFEIYYTELLKFEKYPNRYTKPSTEADRQDISRIQTNYKDLLTSIVEKNPNRNFFTTFEIETEKNERFANNYMRIPQGMLINYTKSVEKYDDYKMPEFIFQPLTQNDYYHNFIRDAYYNAYLSRANYLMNFQKLDEAEALIKKAEALNTKGSEIKLLQNKIRQMKTAPAN